MAKRTGSSRGGGRGRGCGRSGSSGPHQQQQAASTPADGQADNDDGQEALARQSALDQLLAPLLKDAEGPWRVNGSALHRLNQSVCLSGSEWVPLKALLRLLRDQYNTTERDVLILGPEVHQQLLERTHEHLQNTTYASGQAGGLHAPRTPTRGSARRQQQAQEPEGQQHQPEESRTLLELELHRVLGGPVEWVAPQKEQQQQQQDSWTARPPKLIVLVVASSSGRAAAATAAVAAAQQKQKEQVGQQEGEQQGGQGQQGSAAVEDEAWAHTGSGSESGSEDGSKNDAQQGSEVGGTAAGTEGKQPQPPQQQQQQQQTKELAPHQKQHFSLLLLYNAEGLGHVAALNEQARAKQGRELQQQGQQQHVTWLLHLDPHAAAPWPCCSAGVRNGTVPCSHDVSGPDTAVVVAPLLAFLQQAYNQEGRARKAVSGRVAGQPSALTKLQLLTNPQQPHPALKVLRCALPPLPHVCRHEPAAACLCPASVLVALDWLLASPPDEAALRQRERSEFKGHFDVPLSPGWYPPFYARLMSEQLLSMAQLQVEGQLQQQVQQMEMQQQEELNQMQQRHPGCSEDELLSLLGTGPSEEEQQQRDVQLQAGAAPAVQQLVVGKGGLLLCWQQAQKCRDAQGLLCYPGPMAHTQLLAALVHAQCGECYIDPEVMTDWGQGGTADLLTLLDETSQQRGWNGKLLPSGFTAPGSAGSAAAAGSSAAAALPTGRQLLLDAAMDKRKAIARLPLQGTHDWQRLHALQQPAVTLAAHKATNGALQVSTACSCSQLATYVAQQSAPKLRHPHSRSYLAHSKVKPTPAAPTPASAEGPAASVDGAGGGLQRGKQPVQQRAAARSAAPRAAPGVAAALAQAAGRAAAAAPRAAAVSVPAADTTAAPAAVAAAAAGRQAAAPPTAGASPATAEVSPTGVTGVTPVLEEPALERQVTVSPASQGSMQADAQAGPQQQGTGADGGDLVTPTAAAAAAAAVCAMPTAVAPAEFEFAAELEAAAAAAAGSGQQQQDKPKERKKQKVAHPQQQQQQQQQLGAKAETDLRKKKRIKRSKANAGQQGETGVSHAPTAAAAAALPARPSAAAHAGRQLGQPSLQQQQQQLPRQALGQVGVGAAAVQPAQPSRSLQARAVSSDGPFSGLLSQRSASLCSQQQRSDSGEQVQPRQLQLDLDAADSLPSGLQHAWQQQLQQAVGAQQSMQKPQAKKRQRQPQLLPQLPPLPQPMQQQQAAGAEPHRKKRRMKKQQYLLQSMPAYSQPRQQQQEPQQAANAEQASRQPCVTEEQHHQQQQQPLLPPQQQPNQQAANAERDVQKQRAKEMQQEHLQHLLPPQQPPRQKQQQIQQANESSKASAAKMVDGADTVAAKSKAEAAVAAADKQRAGGEGQPSRRARRSMSKAAWAAQVSAEEAARKAAKEYD